MLFIAGGGRFGSEAVKAAEAKGWRALVVDVDAASKASKIARQADFVVGDAISLALALMLNGIVPRFFVPAIPGHFAGELVLQYLQHLGVSPAPEGSLAQRAANLLPSDVVLGVDPRRGLLIASYMPSGMLCKVPCPQPARCPVTGKLREMPMHQLLQTKLSSLARLYVLESILLAPMVGGFRGEQLVRGLKDLSGAQRGVHVAVATSCKCHAIVSFFTVK